MLNSHLKLNKSRNFFVGVHSNTLTKHLAFKHLTYSDPQTRS